MVARRIMSASTMRTAMFSLLASLIALDAFAANSDGRHQDTDVVVTAVSGDRPSCASTRRSRCRHES